jgi:hypothetical protein
MSVTDGMFRLLFIVRAIDRILRRAFWAPPDRVRWGGLSRTFWRSDVPRVLGELVHRSPEHALLCNVRICRDALNLVRTAVESKNHPTLCISGEPRAGRYA